MAINTPRFYFLSASLIALACAALCWILAPARLHAAAPPAPTTPPAPPTAAATLKKLRPYFMLGVMSGPHDKWVSDVRKQGAQFDIRYQYLAAGVNTGKDNWRNWDSPPGQFALNYFTESDRMGVIPCLTYYQMYHSLPTGGKGPEDKGNKANVENAATMKAYFEDFRILMQMAGKYGKTVIIHHEPDLWGYFSVTGAFKPNDPDKITVMVKSSGDPDAAKFEDTAAGFGKCLLAIRDKYAPNVLLAWHASKWGDPNPKAIAAFILKCGKWDLCFTDPSDRDAEWKVAHNNAKPADAWWTDKSFISFRDWSGQIHQLTGLPLIAWQIPMGNTYMATCNNTEGHFMDNRVEYFLEDYPNNKHIAEWASAGYIALLWGGGAGGCTGVGDGCKDGITNPTPVKNNKGEKATFPDDDGGYLRLRAANYYLKKPFGVRSPAADPAAEAAKTATSKPALDPNDPVMKTPPFRPR